ncbi:MAG: transposase [Pseudomonadota bacterium]
MGRKSKYEPEYCQAIIDFGEQGFSIEAYAGEIGVNPATLYKWRKVHDEFREAMEISKAKAGLWWERRLQNIAKGEDGNATSAIFGLKNRSDAWKDVTTHEGTVKFEHMALPPEEQKVMLEQMLREALEDQAQGLLTHDSGEGGD